MNNYRRETNRWAAFFLACASIGGLEDTFNQADWKWASEAAVFINQTWTPYGILIFSLSYGAALPKNNRKRTALKAVLMLPSVFMLIITPIHPILELDYRVLLGWAGPFYLCSCYLLIRALWLEKDAARRRSRLVTTLIIVPTLLAVLGFINVARAIRPDFDFFTYISFFIIYSLSLGLLCVFIYGVLGVKLRIEHDPLDTTMKAVSSGTAILNHTIKNEIGKIALSTLNLGNHLAPGDEETKQHLAIIANASSHMLDMVTRIHNQTKAIVLYETPSRLDRIFEESLEQHVLLLDEKGITFSFSPLERPLLSIDPVHIREAIGNMIRNAIEAMSEGGHLHLTLEGDKRYIEAALQDTGSGIPAKQLRQVLEPFYSTKSETANYGLGLSYAYNVMLSSGGTLTLDSQIGIGTRVTLRFPRKKQVKE
ncbi:sensor histidine kinase [Paenibacillus sp. R14(2021)]|uniref:sensor histidine kinase n=1 Tax=Paenibacillus sp. R14(2021) TaxID=2859228 RepID=UPI0021587BE5|nr:sensor histidine kinase [Paenibacillus sp. R14(2021)]